MATWILEGVRRQYTLSGASAVARPSPPAPQPTFRLGVDLVQVDVAVLDRDRRPVRGLTAENFAVLEDGKLRPVVAFTEVELPA